MEWSVLEDGVLPTVIEMEVAVDDDLHVRRAQIVLGERVGGVAVHDLPLLDQPVVAPSNASVDQDRPRARVLDHEPVHRDVVQGAEVCQMKSDDLQRHDRNGETAKTVKSTPT